MFVRSLKATRTSKFALTFLQLSMSLTLRLNKYRKVIENETNEETTEVNNDKILKSVRFFFTLASCVQLLHP